MRAKGWGWNRKSARSQTPSVWAGEIAWTRLPFPSSAWLANDESLNVFILSACGAATSARATSAPAAAGSTRTHGRDQAAPRPHTRDQLQQREQAGRRKRPCQPRVAVHVDGAGAQDSERDAGRQPAAGWEFAQLAQAEHEREQQKGLGRLLEGALNEVGDGQVAQRGDAGHDRTAEPAPLLSSAETAASAVSGAMASVSAVKECSSETPVACAMTATRPCGPSGYPSVDQRVDNAVMGLKPERGREVLDHVVLAAGPEDLPPGPRRAGQRGEQPHHDRQGTPPPAACARRSARTERGARAAAQSTTIAMATVSAWPGTYCAAPPPASSTANPTAGAIQVLPQPHSVHNACPRTAETTTRRRAAASVSTTVGSLEFLARARRHKRFCDSIWAVTGERLLAAGGAVAFPAPRRRVESRGLRKTPHSLQRQPHAGRHGGGDEPLLR